MEQSEIVALIVVGAIAGTAAASVMGWRKSSGRKGATVVQNIVIGVLGALVGGFLFGVLDLRDDLPEFLEASISAADVLVAFVGAIIVIFVVGLIKR